MKSDSKNSEEFKTF